MTQEGNQGSTTGDIMKSLILKGGSRLLQIGLFSGPPGWLFIGGAALVLVLFGIPFLLVILMMGGGINLDTADAALEGGGLGLKDNYCQAYESPHDYDGDGQKDCSQAVKSIIIEASLWAKMPAGVLVAIGLNENLGDVLILSDSKVQEFSEPGAALTEKRTDGVAPGECAVSSTNNKGPMQIKDADEWEGYKNAVNIATGEGRSPEICNIKDNIYAAAWKLKCDATPPSYRSECGSGEFTKYDYNDDSSSWEKEEVIPMAESYLGACVDAGVDYCNDVWSKYLSTRDENVGMSDAIGAPCGWPAKGQITSVYTDPRGSDQHNAIDIAGVGEDQVSGQDVFNIMTGTLKSASWNSSSSGIIIITSTVEGTNFEVKYVHMAQSAVDLVTPKLNQTISRGEGIGKTYFEWGINKDGVLAYGGSPSSSGTHVHYAINVNGTPVDPMEYAPQALNKYDMVDSPGGCSEAGVNVDDYFTFNPGPGGDWDAAAKTKVAQALSVPIRSETWKDLVFGNPIQKVTLVKGGRSCPVCSGIVNYGVLTLRPFFFNTDGNGLTDRGRVFVITHELTHVLAYPSRSPEIYEQFLTSQARIVEYNPVGEGVIISYPLCDDKVCDGVPPLGEDYAEMAGNYVTDRDPYDPNAYRSEGFNGSLDFPSEYPRHFEFARDILFGGTVF